MIAFNSSEIARWADDPDAHHKLPELVRRLVLATVPMPSFLNMPSGSSVSRPGWDGLLEVDQGNAWVSAGFSAWEFSCEANPRRKATSDYDKRTEDPKGVDAPTIAFLFVTPRKWDEKWDGKLAWANERSKAGPWAHVRALDADDLVAWLEQAPAVAHWFARLIGKLPATGVVSLDEWWENWSTVANPRISAGLVTAGRQDQVVKISEWARGNPSRCYVQGDTQDEAIAFLAGSAHADESGLGSALLARAVVVENADAWRSIEGHPSPLILVRNFQDGNVSPKIAVGRGHHVLTPLGEHEKPTDAEVTLPRLGRQETLQELIEMGLSEAKARALVRSAARRLSVMRRRLVDEAGGPTPEWATPLTPRSIVTLVLVGQWEEDNESNSESDKEIVAKISGQSYGRVVSDLADLTNTADPPLTKVGNRRRLTSHEEAWHLLAPRLTSSEVQRFERVAIDVLGNVSPEFELPIAQRYLANVYGKVLPHSDTLREGIARSLALMGTQAERARNVDTASYVPARVVSAVLGGGRGWRIWATLSDTLTTLAEASPEALLDAIESDLDAEPSPFDALFAQEGDVLFGGAPHTGLLWALELLAWSPDHFARAAKCLARLAEIDQGGQVANRPAESLVSLFLPWIRFSEVSDGNRLDVLRGLLDTVPGAGWRLLVEAYSRNGGVTVRQPPSWRPWAQDGSPYPTVEECNAYIGQMTKMLLNGVGAEVDRWADLVEIIQAFSPEDRKQALDLLSQRAKALRHFPAAHDLRTRLRGILHSHRSYPDAAWAMNAEELAAIEAVYEKLTPADPVAAHAWLFDKFPDLPEGVVHDYEEANQTIAEARRKAIRAAYESDGVSAILKIAEASEEPHEVGVAVASVVDPELALDLAIKRLGSTDLKLRNVAHGVLRALFLESGWKILDEAIATAKVSDSTPQMLADIYLVALAVRETWNRLDDESQEVRTAYWKSIRWANPSEWDAEDLDFAVQRLLSVRRSVDAVNWLTLQPIPDELVIKLLEAVPADVAVSPDQASRVEVFRIISLLEQLDQSDDVSDDKIACLEIPYFETLQRDRPELALHRLIVRDPRFFADVITWVFKRADGEAEEPVDDHVLKRWASIAFNVLWNVITRAFKRADGEVEESVGDHVLKRRASIAIDVLWKLRLLPGLMEDGSVDVKALSTWVNEARRLCRERDREDIGDQQIGQVLANAPMGEDGIWPCEPVRDLLDDLESQDIGIGFIMGKRNLRGTTTRGMFDGGAQERSIAEKHRGDAMKIGARWPFTAKLLRRLAATYESEATLEDQRADWYDQFES